MVKRAKRIEKGIESLKEEIEEHFKKLDNNLLGNDKTTARYHIKEIDKSLIANLEKKMLLLSKNSKENIQDRELLNKLRKKLEEYKNKLSVEQAK